MTVAGLSAGVEAIQAGPPRRRRLTPARVTLVLAAAFVVVSLVRVGTHATDLTSSGTIGAALALAVPIALAGLGGLWAERAGVVNIGLEGMMVLGTWGAAWQGYSHGPWVGALAGIGFGAAGGLIHALATVTFGVDQIISGVAVNLIAPGLALFLTKLVFAKIPGGGQKQSPPLTDVKHVTVPGIASGLESIEDKHWFLLSDLAGVVRGVTYQLSLFVVLTVVVFVLSWYLLWRTSFGLRLRSCGEAPHAAESLGVNVYRYKYAAVVVSGAVAGLGGAVLSISSGSFRDGQTGGRGFIGLAAMIFGNWRPGGLAIGSGLFGFTDALQSRGSTAVHALLLLLGIALLALAVVQWLAGRRVLAVVALALGAIFILWFSVTSALPSELVGATPYVVTLLVLALASQRLRMPAADGRPYRRGEE